MDNLKFGLGIGLFLSVATQAQAFPCRFTTECYEDVPCRAAQSEIDVRIEDKIIASEFGDLIIVAVKNERNLLTAFASGGGGEYLLSVTPTAARFTAQNNSGPEVISYLGRCEGAF